MIIQPRQNTGRQGTAPSVDDLLNAAVMEGGAVGEVAERMMNPKKNFYTTMTEATFKTFSGFINTLQTPSYAVAGLLDPDMTVAEAVKRKVTPSDVIFDSHKPTKSDSFLDKSVYTLTKFGVDTLLDPLTYVTFGASRGLVGLSRGADAFAGTKLAEQLGTKEGMRVYLSEAGEDLANNYLKANRTGLRQTFLKNERIKMVNKGVPEEEIVSRLKALEDETSDYMIKEVLDGGLNKKQATQAVANLLEKNPHLTKELIDRGGVKFFGKSILSGQRIRAVRTALPGMTALDKAMEPVRGTLGNMFSTKYAGGQRLTDEYIDKSTKWRNIYEAHRDRLTINGIRIKKQLNLTDEEWEFVTAAAETGLKPSDPRAADVWSLLHDTPPTNGTIRDEVWRGLVSVNRMNARSRGQLLESGIKVRNLPNYMPHLFVKEKVTNIPFKPSTLKQTTNRTKFAKIATLIDERGVRTPARMLDVPDKDGNVRIIKLVDGKEVEEKVKFIDKSREMRRVEDVFAKQSEPLQKELRTVVDRILSDRASLKGAVSTRLVADVTKMLDDISDILPEDKRLLADAISDFVSDANIDKIIGKRLERFYSNGVKLSSGQKISKPDIDKLAIDLVMAKGEATSIVSRINKLLTSGVKLPHAKKATPGEMAIVDKEIAALADKMKNDVRKIKADTIARKIDPEKIIGLLKQVVARTSKNPAGLNRVIDRLITNKQLARELKDELGDISRAFEIEKNQILEGAGKFVSENGKAYERVRASVQEARDLGVDFEENALVASLLASDDAIRVSTSRHFIKEIGEKFGVAESQAPNGFVPVEKLGLTYEGQDLAKWLTSANGERLYFNPAVAKHLEQFTTSMSADEGIASFLKGYDGLQNYFKAAVTSIFPAFHGRNALSNVFLMYNRIGVEALNPANHVASANMLDLQRKTSELQRKLIRGTASASEMSELMSKTVFTDKTGYNWSWGELRTQIIDNVVAFHHKNLGQTDQLKFGTSEVAEAARKMFPKTKRDKIIQKTAAVNPLNSDNYLFKGGFKIGQTIEDYSRTLMFMSYLKKTGDPVLAARQTKLALFDYSNLTKFEKEVMRRIVPFYSFSRKNIELQIATLMQTPGRTAQQIRAVQSLGDYFNEPGLSEEEINKLPEWARKGYNVVSKREGSHVTLLRTLGTPMEELFNRSDPKENLGIISPLIKAPIEFASGYSFFHGRPISEVTQADAYRYAPDFIKKFIGFAEVNYTDANGAKQTYYTSFAPWRMHTINQLQPFGRFFSEVNRIEKAPDQAAKMNALFLGFGTREFDLEREEARRIKENEEELQSLLEQAGLGYSFKRYVPESTNDGIRY